MLRNKIFRKVCHKQQQQQYPFPLFISELTTETAITTMLEKWEILLVRALSLQKSTLPMELFIKGKTPAKWNQSFLIDCYRGKRNLLPPNYCCLKLLEQVLKIIEKVASSIIRHQVNIDAMSFGFQPGSGCRDAISLLH